MLRTDEQLLGALARQQARTRRFTLGRPRSFTVAPGATHALFLRAGAGDDPVHALWHLDLGTGEERTLADPRTLAVDEHDLPPEERARRERVRESGGGIVAYATDDAVRLAAFALGGRLFIAEVGGQPRMLDVDGPVVDPRPDPTGRRVAFVRDRALHVTAPEGGAARRVAGEDDRAVAWGLPDFIAAEEMDRVRGYWWAPDGERLAVARVDESPVLIWHVADAVEPANPPTALRYPAAGTANADVTLHIVDLEGRSTEVAWDRAAFEYLAAVRWDEHGPLTLVVQSRDQHTLRVLAADPATGVTRLLHEEQDPHWVELVDGNPRWIAGAGALDPAGRMLHVVADGDRRALAVDGVPVPGSDLDVRRLIGASADAAVVTASPGEPTAVSVWRVPLDGGGPEPLSRLDGIADAVFSADATVVTEAGLDAPWRTTIRTRSATAADLSHPRTGSATVADLARRGGPTSAVGVEVGDRSETPVIEPRVELAELGQRRLRAALVLPRAWEPADGTLPVLLDPYGGPHFQRVVRRRNAYLESQYFAEAGYAVLVVDGRGSPGRGLAWEREVARDLATPTLDDQVDALHAAAERWPDALDSKRVAIRGWSFGGFLAALAVLRRPDVFAAAIAGAPVTDQRLYDTHYTERYLGDPNTDPDAYAHSSLLDDAPNLQRPLLLIHGLADDNVVAAHTLRLSRALLEAGRPHRVLPLSGVTHMTPQEAVAENLLRLQRDFLDEVLNPR